MSPPTKKGATVFERALDRALVADANSSKKKPDGGVAFPQHPPQTRPGEYATWDGSGGLTKRELFAAMAMEGFCLQATGRYEAGPCNSAIVERSVLLADMLIAELGK